MIKKLMYLLFSCLLILISVLLFNTFRFRSKQNKAIRYQPPPAAPDSAIAHLQRLIQFKTISYSDSTLPDPVPFTELHQYLQTAWPLVHQTLQREVISQYSLVYHWK